MLQNKNIIRKKFAGACLLILTFGVMTLICCSLQYIVNSQPIIWTLATLVFEIVLWYGYTKLNCLYRKLYVTNYLITFCNRVELILIIMYAFYNLCPEIVCNFRSVIYQLLFWGILIFIFTFVFLGYIRFVMWIITKMFRSHKITI